MKCHIMFRKGHSVVVRYQDEKGNLWAKDIPARLINDQKGTSFNLPIETLKHGVDYGFSFDVIMSERVIDSQAIQNAMRAHGVWTYEDMLDKPNQVHAAIMSVIMMIQGELVKGARDALGR